jgi:hypothetical protein
MWGLGQHTLLDIVVGSCGASGNTLYWILLLGYTGPQATYFTGIVVGLRGALGNTLLLDIVVGLCGASGNTLYCCWVMRSYANPTSTSPVLPSDTYV